MKRYTELLLVPFVFSQVLFDFHYIPFYKKDKIPFLHLHIDIFTYLIKKSITESIRPHHDRDVLEKNQHTKIHVNQKDKNHN
jgi:hypothetical protein